MTHINDIDWSSDKLVIDGDCVLFNENKNFFAEINNMNIKVDSSYNHKDMKNVFCTSMCFNNNRTDALKLCPMINVHKNIGKYVNKNSEYEYDTNWCFMYIFMDNIKIYINNNLVILSNDMDFVKLTGNKLNNKHTQIKFNITNKHKHVCVNNKYIIEIFELRYNDKEYLPLKYSINIKNNVITLVCGNHEIVIDHDKCRDILNESEIIIA